MVVVEHAPSYRHGKKVEVFSRNGQERLRIEFAQKRSLDLPVFSIREPKNLSKIADLVCSDKPAVFEAAGVFGLLAEVKNTPKPNGAGRKFWSLKQGRNPLDKVPIICLPESAGNLIATSKLNKHIRNVISEGISRKNFWGHLPLHVIAPVIDRIPLVNSETFITTPEESARKGLEYVPEPTICLYFQQDQDWESLARGIQLRTPYSLFGVSSFNYSGEQPPYDFAELESYLVEHPDLAESVAGIIYDPAAWDCDIASSQTQVRLPLKHEEPVLTITRPGPVSAQMIEEHTGFKTRILENAKHAVSKHTDNFNFEPGVLKYIDQSARIMRDRQHGVLPPRISNKLAA